MMMRGQNRPARTRDAVIPSPTKGWVQSGNITRAGLDEAEVLENFFPTAQGAMLRGGSAVYANIGTSVRQLMSYASGGVSDMFATTATGIFDCDRINLGGAAFADVTGLSSGDWSYTQTSTAGGQFMVLVNGVNAMMYWNGTNFFPVNGAAVNQVSYDALTVAFTVGATVTGGTSGASAVIVAIRQTSATVGTLLLGAITLGPFVNNEALTGGGGSATADGGSSSASTITITGVSTSTLSQVWLFKERLFFVKKDSQSVWYLPVESIGGAASEINLGSVFRKGGTMLFGAAWSLDSGSGLDDKCVFMSSNGEVAIYTGVDPASATAWTLDGVYELPVPIGKTGFFKTGGDLAILTEDGILSLSGALYKDRAALQDVTITFPIEDAWKEAVSRRTVDFNITATLWQSRAELLVGVPSPSGQSVSYVSNARTGAWASYTGWDVRCAVVSSDQLYFGTNAGLVMTAESGGSDNGVAYTGNYIPKFSQFGAAQRKHAMHAAATVDAPEGANFRLTAYADYKITVPSAPSPLPSVGGSVWGTAIWGTAFWGGSVYTTPQTIWQGVAAQGYALAVGLQVTSNQTTAPDFQLLATHVRYETGASL